MALARQGRLIVVIDASEPSRAAERVDALAGRGAAGLVQQLVDCGRHVAAEEAVGAFAGEEVHGRGPVGEA